MEREVNGFMTMGISTILNNKNNKKQYSVNNTQQYKIYVHVKTEINKH